MDFQANVRINIRKRFTFIDFPLDSFSAGDRWVPERTFRIVAAAADKVDAGKSVVRGRNRYILQ